MAEAEGNDLPPGNRRLKLSRDITGTAGRSQPCRALNRNGNMVQLEIALQESFEVYLAAHILYVNSRQSVSVSYQSTVTRRRPPG